MGVTNHTSVRSWVRLGDQRENLGLGVKLELGLRA